MWKRQECGKLIDGLFGFTQNVFRFSQKTHFLGFFPFPAASDGLRFEQIRFKRSVWRFGSENLEPWFADLSRWAQIHVNGS